MDRRIVITLGESLLGRGFPVTLVIDKEETQPALEVSGSLPADPELYQLYATWATIYRQLVMQSFIDQEEQGWSVTDMETCRNTARLLSDRLNRWLQADEFRPIQDAILTELSPADAIQMLIETDNIWLRRLPWHVWDLYEYFPHLEMALTLPADDPIARQPALGSNVRVLSVLSSGDDIRIQLDQRSLAKLPHIDISLLVGPQRSIVTRALTSNTWDILFVSGQGPANRGGEAGRIYLNGSDSMTLEEWRLMLEQVAERGLQIGVFNSWDGMAIARTFDGLGLSQVVVMREPAPNDVAQHFFKHFLSEFAGGASFYGAVRLAREALNTIDVEFPCVGWLPVIFQNPTVTPPHWTDWVSALREARGQPLMEQPTESAASPPAANQAMPPYQSGLSFSPQTEPFPVAGPSPSPSTESLIHSRYQIQKVLGRGGFGQTYLAIDTHRFGERCVLKQFIPTSRSEASLRKARELFQREAKVLYQIDHPQVPKFLAWFTHDEDLFIVQEYVDGESYSNVLRDRQRQGQTFSESEVIQLLKELLPVLDYLHSIDIVHRDISPANIMFSNEKQKPILIDFGVVKEVVNQILSGQYSTFAHPPKATLVGKPGYSPPEQIQLGDCFPCSDFYALGMTVLVLLTGCDARVSRNQWRTYSGVQEPLAKILERMLADRPRERYQTAAEILADLNRLSSAESEFSDSPDPFIWPSSFEPDPLPQATGTGAGAGERHVRPGLSSPSLDTGDSAALMGELTSDFVDRCERSLAQYIGPVASFAVDEVLARHHNLDRLRFVEQLAAEIPNPDEAQAFRKQLRLLPQPELGSQARAQDNAPAPGAAPIASPAPRPVPQSYTSESQWGAPPPVATPAPASSAFVERCRYELARCIGPMANFVIDDILDRSPTLSPPDLIEAIAREIPSDKAAHEFRQRLNS